MNKIVNKIIECDYPNIPFEKFPLDEKFGLKIKKNNVNFEFLINIKSSSNKLIIIGSGAIPEEKTLEFENKPRFHRHSWNFEESTIFYNDPTRYINNTLLGGWGIGTPNEWYVETIKNILLMISNYFNYKNEDILFYGSSLGGFMSILLSTLVKGSKALADVPQLTFEKTKHFNRIKDILFPGLSEEYIDSNFKYRLNVLNLIEREKYIPNLTLVFDVGELDIKEHYINFFKEITKLTKCYNTNYIKIIINPIDDHHFLDKEMTLGLIKNIINNNSSEINNDASYDSLFIKNKKINEKFSKFQKKYNIIILNNLIFNIPKEYNIFSYNYELCSYDTISNGDCTIYFVLESTDKNVSCKKFVNIYINYLKRENGKPILEIMIINNIEIFKVKNLSTEIVRYWFKVNNNIIQLFTYYTKEYTDSIIVNMIKNIEVL